MITCKALQADRRQFLALTGLTLSEFQRLLSAFAQAYQKLYPANQTVAGQPRQRSVGGGCKGRLEQPEEKLLFLLVYLKTYPLQAVMAAGPAATKALRRLGFAAGSSRPSHTPAGA